MGNRIKYIKKSSKKKIRKNQKKKKNEKKRERVFIPNHPSPVDLFFWRVCV